jgi:LytR cell envelope-related transcriptional attenuator
MGFVPFAFLVHQFVSSVGADVGFAAIVGLAILVLLYFAQARETANLREQSNEATQRVELLEARLAQLARRPAAPAPAAPPVGAPTAAAAPARGVPAIAPVPAPSGIRAMALTPGPPAGVAAPALAAATRLIPTAAVAAGGQPSATAITQAPTAAPGLGSETAVAAPGESAAGPSPYAAPGDVSPATVAGGGNGSARQYAAAPGEGRQAASLTAARAGGRPVVGGAPVRSSAPSGPRRSALVTEAPPGRSRAGRAVALLLGVLVLAGVVVVLLVVTGLGATKHPSGAATTGAGPGSRAARRGARFNPSTVTVAVLNGTGSAGISGLARRTADRLAALGYRLGTVTTASNQTLTSTVIGYMPGHRGAAVRVADALKLPPGSVKPIDSGTQALACSQGGPCRATVVVTAGADLAGH